MPVETRKTERVFTARPARPAGRSLRVGLFGAAPDTANHGVSALCRSVVEGIWSACPGSNVTVFDHGRGVRSWEHGPSGGTSQRAGAYLTRRLHRPESFRRIDLALSLGGTGSPTARVIAGLDAVLDISGGDSFTDMYGPHRLRAVLASKNLGLRHGIPLVLLPQTYGPFKAVEARAAAGRVVRRAAMAWARDERSFEILRDLLGSAFDPDRHRCGVDVAFLLRAARPPHDALALLSTRFRDRLESEVARGEPLIGFNVSGLIWHDAEQERRYGFKADYRSAVVGVLTRVLRETEASVMLVPHVVTPHGSYESDPQACDEAAAAVLAACPAAAGRIAVAPALNDPREAKWLIARCDWFGGTRMHATIAALSSGVPSGAISYSPKTLGVFETCGQGDRVADPTRLDTSGLVDHLWRSWQQREVAKASLAVALPGVLGAADEQMSLIAAECVRLAGCRCEPAA